MVSSEIRPRLIRISAWELQQSDFLWMLKRVDVVVDNNNDGIGVEQADRLWKTATMVSSRESSPFARLELH